MNVLIIGRQQYGEKNDAKLLAKNLANHNKSKSLSIKAAYFEDLQFEIDEKAVNIYFENATIDQFDLIILIGWSHKKLYNDIAHAIAYICKQKNIKVWNSELIAARSMTKISQLVRLSGKNVFIPDTYFSLSKDLLIRYLKNAQYPLVLKDPEASRGRDNHLANNYLVAKKLVEQYSGNLLAQSYIANDGNDYRVLVANGESVFTIKRTAKEKNHLTNISAGGRASIVQNGEIPDKVLRNAEYIATLFNRELCGIDFIKNQDNGKYYFLEINLTPQIANGVFVTEKVKAIMATLQKGV